MNKSTRHLWVWVLTQACIVLAVIGWRIYRGPLPYEPATSTRLELDARLKTALDEFSNDCGQYPATLNALLICPTNSSNGHWHGPYLNPAKIPQDPWKHDYVYRFPGIHNTNGFDLYSCGPDGISKSGGNDPDDINNWDPHSPRGGVFLDASAGDPEFHSMMKALLIIPLFNGMVLISAIFSKEERKALVTNPAPYSVWFLISLLVLAVFFASKAPLAGV